MAVCNPGKDKEILLIAHYDHLYHSVGADDNLTGVAAILEAARILPSINLDITVKFVALSLEEQHSGFEKVLMEETKKLGLINDQRIPTSYKNFKFLDSFNDEYMNFYNTGEKASKVIERKLESNRKGYSEKELAYVLLRKDLEQRLEKELPNKEIPRVTNGSHHYVEQNKNELKKIAGVINLDAIGYISKKEHSQATINGIDFNTYEKTGVEDVTVGDYIFVIAEKNSIELGQKLLKQAEGVLPSLLLAVPLTYDEIKVSAEHLLRSDSTNFLERGSTIHFIN